MWLKGFGLFLCLLLLTMCTHVPKVYGSPDTLLFL